MHIPDAVAEAIGWIVYEFWLIQPLIPTYLHLLVSALFPIYAGAHASLSRPSSAAKPEKRPKRLKHDVEDEDTEEEDVQKMEGLSPSDAILFPLLAGSTLAGLYFIIKWLQDPALLNKILNWYFAIFGIFSVSRLIADCLGVIHSVIFPRRYADCGVIYHVHGKEWTATPVSGSANGKARSSPLPGALSRIPLPSGLLKALWFLRQLPEYKWGVKLHFHTSDLKLRIGLHGLVGFICALSATIYFNVVDKPWFLTNLMGFAFAYNALQLMSPTTFGTGSLILGALFFYDIYFVFFTPMMVTVAKSLDVPIKLVFPRPAATDEDAARRSYAMLGLGDVVLPGIVIGLALRFDLYLFYLRKQTKSRSDATAEGSEVIVKPKYVSLSGRWGEHLWTHSWFGYPAYPAPKPNVQYPHTTFPKPYFKAGMTGYIIGMICTLLVMHVFGHAQPALLYLVPGVLIAVWGTALVRGEWKEVWEFSEAVEEEEANQKDKQKKQQSESFFSPAKSQRNAEKLEKAMGEYVKHGDADSTTGETSEPTTSDPVSNNTDAMERKIKDNIKAGAKSSKPHRFFSISVERPPQLKQKTKSNKPSGDNDSGSDTRPGSADSEIGVRRRKANWKAREKEGKFGEPPGKRLRTA